MGEFDDKLFAYPFHREIEAQRRLSRYSVFEWLWKLKQVLIRCREGDRRVLKYFPGSEDDESIRRFMAGGFGMFTLLYADSSGFVPPRSRVPPTDHEFLSTMGAVQQLLLHDPLPFVEETNPDEEFEKIYLSVLGRMFGEQAPYQQSSLGLIARNEFLWGTCVDTASERHDSANIKNLIGELFQREVGVPREEYAAWVLFLRLLVERNEFGFCRRDGLELLAGNDQSGLGRKFKKILDRICISPEEAREEVCESELRELKDNDQFRFPMSYPENPLIMRPLVRPFGKVTAIDPKHDYCFSVLPEFMVPAASRLPYREMKDSSAREFTGYFGYVFEEYVGLILEHAASDRRVVSEKYFSTYLDERVVDWGVLEGGHLILFEVKARSRPRHAYMRETGDWLDGQLNTIRGGWLQTESVAKAALRGDLDFDVEKVTPIVITYEPHYMLAGDAGEDFLRHRYEDSELPDPDFEWKIWSVAFLEKIQAACEKGCRFSDVARYVSEEGSFSGALQRLEQEYGGLDESSLIQRGRERAIRKVKESLCKRWPSLR